MKRISLILAALLFVLAGCASLPILGPKRVVMPPLAQVPALGGKTVFMSYNPMGFCPNGQSRSDDIAIVAPILERHMSARGAIMVAAAAVKKVRRPAVLVLPTLRPYHYQRPVVREVQEAQPDFITVVCLSRVSEYHQNLYGQGDHRYTVVVSIRVLDKNRRVAAQGHSQHSFWQHDEAAWSESFIRAAEVASRTMKETPR